MESVERERTELNELAYSVKPHPYSLPSNWSSWMYTGPNAVLSQLVCSGSVHALVCFLSTDIEEIPAFSDIFRFSERTYNAFLSGLWLYKRAEEKMYVILRYSLCFRAHFWDLLWLPQLF